MKTEYYNDRRNLEHIFSLHLSSREASSSLSPAELVPQIRLQLALAVVEKIMEKIGPAIDKALAEISLENDNPHLPGRTP